MTDANRSETIIIGGPNRTNIAEGFMEIGISRQHYHPELIPGRTKPVKRILFLSANPHIITRQYFDEEVRKISNSLLLSTTHHRWEIQKHISTELRDLRWALLEHEPHIVHFIGQSEPNGLFVKDSRGCPTRISPTQLAASFELCAVTVECVILNAAYWESQAEAICQHINYVLSIPNPLKENTSHEFFLAFYDALGADKSIEEAFYYAIHTGGEKYPHGSRHPNPILKIKKDLDLNY